MKKILSLLLGTLLLIGAVVNASAAPALPGLFPYTQPDGTVIMLQRHGDEFCNWTTTASGEVVVLDAYGFWRPSSLAQAQAISRRRAPRLNPERRWSSHDNPPATNFGDRKVLCIIANFSDSTFVLENPREKFSNMLNQQGYSFNGAHGSVRDYYLENSYGLYRPQFDVYGPVNLSQSSAYYDANGASTAILEAFGMLENQINVADYDTDNNGDIDMVLFYYPGHNEAEGAGPESIWPHQSSGYFGMMGSKRFVRYFCTSELRGATGSEMCGIGTTCHEFAHSLGLPDFYDTDYENNGQNSYTTSMFDLMASGNYNDRGRRPPYLSGVERNMLGWLDNPATFSQAGDIEILSIGSDPQGGAVYYRQDANLEGEYFVYEYRPKVGWDSALHEEGLIIYHVDKSNRPVGGSTAATLWANTNKINAYGGHPCYYLLSSAKDVHSFPGSSNVTTFTPLDWDGNDGGFELHNIAVNGSKASFTLQALTSRKVYGSVLRANGSAVQGAQVVISIPSYPFNVNGVASLLPTDISVNTDSNGRFTIDLSETPGTEFIVSVHKDGFVSQSRNFVLPSGSRFQEENFTLLAVNEFPDASMKKISGNAVQTYGNATAGSSVAIGFAFSDDELVSEGFAGRPLNSVSFFYGTNNATVEDVYIVVQFDDTRVLERKVTQPLTSGTWCTVDVSDAGIVLPSDKDVVIGVGYTNISGSGTLFPLALTQCPQDTDYACMKCNDFLQSTIWGDLDYGESWGFMVMASVGDPDPNVKLQQLGYAALDMLSDVPAVVAPTGKTLHSVSWTLDGAAVTTPPAKSTLASGTHIYTATVTYYDGTSERVRLAVTVE